MLHKLEGESITVRCQYQLQQGWNKMKHWCKVIREYTCDIIVSNARIQKGARHSLQDYPRSGFFSVTMTELRVEDSGIYWCGIGESYRIFGLRAIHLVVSQGEFFPSYLCFSDFLNHKVLELERILKIISFNLLIPENWGLSGFRAEPAPELRPAGFRLFFLPHRTHFREHFCCC